MLNTLKSLGKTSVIYGLGSLSSRLLGFVLLPLYTRYLTPDDYGVLAILTITASVVSTIVQLGLGSALFWAIIYKEIDKDASISTALYFMLAESALIFGGMVAFAPQITQVLFETPQYTGLLQLVFLTGILEMVPVVFMAVLRIQEQARRYAIFSVAYFVTSTVMKIVFIAVLGLGLDGVIWSNLIVAGGFGVIYVVILWPNLTLRFSAPILFKMLSFGAPLVPINLVAIVMTSSDRYFLQHFSTSAEVGLYTLGYNLGMGILLAVQAVQLAWPAQFLSIAKTQDAEQQFSRLLTYYTLGLGFFALMISVLAREAVIILTTPPFYAAYSVVPIIVFSYVFYGMRNMTNVGVMTQNKNQSIIPVNIGAAVLNLLLNLLLIPGYGMMGAAWSTFISYVVLLAAQTWINLRYWYIPYEYRRLLKVMVGWLLIYGLSLLVLDDNLWASLAVKCLLLAAYPIYLYAVRFYTPQELGKLRRSLSSTIHYLRARGF